MAPLIELVESDLAAERIAVNPEKARCARLVTTGPVQRSLDTFLFEFVDGFAKVNSALHHLPDQGFQLIFHGRTLRTKIVDSRKLRLDLNEFVTCYPLIGFPVLCTRCFNHFGGEYRTGRLLVPSDPFEVVADILLVERRLRAAGLVAFRWPETR